MTAARFVPLLALPLLAAACARPTPIAAPAPPPRAAVPTTPEMAEAVRFVANYCYDPDGIVDCAAGPREVRIDAARCIPIAPEDGKRSAACRLDWTEIMDRPGKDRSYRDLCVRFILLDIEGAPDRNFWTVRYTPRDHVCEVPAR